jgi:hypothetical protein
MEEKRLEEMDFGPYANQLARDFSRHIDCDDTLAVMPWTACIKSLATIYTTVRKQLFLLLDRRCLVVSRDPLARS